MPRPCSSCEHPQVREIDRRLRADTPYVDIALWLEKIGTPVHRTSIARHAEKHVAGAVNRPRGPRTVSPDFLQAVVDTAHEGLADESLHVTVRDGIGAAAEINRQKDRGHDRDLFLKIALALSGGGNLPRIVGPEVDVLEGEFRPLLLDAGDESEAVLDPTRGGVRRR